MCWVATLGKTNLSAAKATTPPTEVLWIQDLPFISPIHLCTSASATFSSPRLLNSCFALSNSWLSKCWCCLVELLGLLASKGLLHSITKSSQIHQWVSQHFPNQLVYCVSDRLLANTSFCDHCHNRSSSWEWTNWHMTDALHRVTFKICCTEVKMLCSLFARFAFPNWKDLEAGFWSQKNTKSHVVYLWFPPNPVHLDEWKVPKRHITGKCEVHLGPESEESRHERSSDDEISDLNSLNLKSVK